jgi:carbonic anhydrase
MKYLLFCISLMVILVSVTANAKESHQQVFHSSQAKANAAIAHLLEDNAKFSAARSSAYFEPFIEGQSPLVTVVGCSDSRVHMHAVDQTPDNDVFVIRNIGNQLATAQGSVEYGVHHLHTPLLLFIGHSGCGAVTAALSDYSKESPAIKRELDTIQVNKGSTVTKEVVSNVNNQVAEAIETFASQTHDGSLAVMGAIYDFRDDYHHGQGKLIVINLNGETDPTKIRQSPLLAGIRDVIVGITLP